MFGYKGDPVSTHTFCSSVAAIILIADHFLNSSADSRLDVYSTNVSIHDLHFLFPSPFITGFVFFEAMRVALAVVTPVPSSLCAKGDSQRSTEL